MPLRRRIAITCVNDVNHKVPDAKVPRTEPGAFGRMRRFAQPDRHSQMAIRGLLSQLRFVARRAN